MFAWNFTSPHISFYFVYTFCLTLNTHNCLSLVRCKHYSAIQYSTKLCWNASFSVLLFTGAIALAEVLAESRYLTHVDLKENEIRVAGLMALTLALRMNYHLLHLETPKTFKVEQVFWKHACVCKHIMLFVFHVHVKKYFALNFFFSFHISSMFTPM